MVQKIVKFLLDYNIQVNQSEFAFQIQSHPNYPSLISITDGLNHFNIKHYAIEIDPSEENLKALPNNFLTVLKNNSELLVVTKKGDGTLKISKTNGNRELGQDEFLELWRGIVILIDSKDFHKVDSPKQSKKLNLAAYTICLMAPFLYFIYQSTTNHVLIQFALAAIGLMVALLIKRSESGSGPVVLEKFCTSIKGFDCHAVTQSSGSKIFGKIDMASLSFIYFSSVILFLFVGPINRLDSSILALFFILAIPITLYSIFYQGIVVKKWCPLCLATVLIVWLQAISSLDMMNLELISGIIITDLTILSMCVLFSAALWYRGEPIYDSLLEDKAKVKELLRFKKNFPLFASALQNVSTIDTYISHSGEEIILGSPDALIELMVITNPLCTFCSSAHSEIDKLLERFGEKVKVRIRFNVQSTKSGTSHQISSSLIQIYHDDNKEYFAKALGHAFSGGKMTQDEWIGKYSKDTCPRTNSILEDQLSWCRKNGINFTPAFFVNSKKIPEPYELKDFKYFIDDLYEEFQQREVLEVMEH